MTPSGSVTEFPLPVAPDEADAGAGPVAITVGSDGNLWFTEESGSRIGRMTPGGVLTEFKLPSSAFGPIGITRGPDGNIWFTDTLDPTATAGGAAIARITPTGTITEFSVRAAGQQGATDCIAAGPDGNLWFDIGVSGNPLATMAKMTTNGVILAEYQIPYATGGGSCIVAGPDGRMWFTAIDNIGAITMSGSVTEYVLVPPADLGSKTNFAITQSLGDVWFTEQASNAIGRITPAGTATDFIVPTTNSGPTGITAGPDGNPWFTESSQDGDKIGTLRP
jgi:streptogramin lyase